MFLAGGPAADRDDQEPNPRMRDQDESEAALIAAAAEGSLRAFEELYRRHSRRICRLALRVTGSEQDAADATQEAFVAAFRGIGAFRSQAKFATWLYRIAIRECTRVCRRQDRSQAALEGADQSLPDDSPQSDPHRTASGVEFETDLQAALATLSDLDRAVFVLAVLDRLPYAEVAEACDLSVSAVKARVHRARVALREKLRDHWET